MNSSASGKPRRIIRKARLGQMATIHWFRLKRILAPIFSKRTPCNRTCWLHQDPMCQRHLSLIRLWDIRSLGHSLSTRRRGSGVQVEPNALVLVDTKHKHILYRLPAKATPPFHGRTRLASFGNQEGWSFCRGEPLVRPD